MADTPTQDPATEPTDARAPERRRRPLLILWAVLAVLVIGVGAIVVAAGDDDPPRLPIALGAGGGDGRAEADTAAADMAMLAWVRYVAGDDLPRLGGEAPAHRLSNVVDRQRLAAVADALGVEGDVVEQPGNRGSWQVEASDGSLLGAGPYSGGSWWYTSGSLLAEGEGGGSSGSSGSGTSSAGCATDDKVCEDLLAREREAAAAEDTPVSDCPPDAADCSPPVPAPIPAPGRVDPPADLPSEDEAERIALDLFGRLGVDVDGARVSTEGPYDAWYVSVEPLVDGMVVSGYVFNAAIGSKGEITTAGGVLNRPDHVGDYPTVDTRAAIDRLNEQMGGFGDGREAGTAEDLATAAVDCGPTAVTPGDPATDPALDIAVNPVCEPAPAEPMEVVLHEAERILVLAPTFDDTDESYLVPGYRFRGDQEGWVDVIAVDDDSLLPPPAEPVEPRPTEPMDPGDTTIVDACAPVEPGPGGAVPDVCLEPRSVEPAPPTGSGAGLVPEPDRPAGAPVGER